MLLRQTTIIFFIGFIIGIVGLVYVQNISPFKTAKISELIEEKQIGEDQEDKLNNEVRKLFEQGLILDYLSPNVFLGFTIFLTSFSCFFLSIHLLIDKLFFKKFFEKASYFDGVRRGILFSICLGVMLYLKLLALGLEIFLVPLVFIMIEVIFFRFFKEDLLKQLTKLRNKYSKKDYISVGSFDPEKGGSL